MLRDDAIVIAAHEEAEQIMEESRLAAERRAEEADRYAMQVLEDLAQKLQVITKQVDNGVQLMRAGRFIDPTDTMEMRNGQKM